MNPILTRIRDQLRRDWLAMLLFLLATLVMTYPIIAELGTTIPSAGNDIFSAFWQKYWLVSAVRDGHNPNFTPYLFHPTGLDITFQPRRWAAFGTWIPLAAVFGDIAGYNLNVLLGLWLSAYTTYLLILYLTGDRMAGWIGGALLAFYPQHVNRGLGQPNTGSIQLMPLVILLMLMAFDRLEKHWRDEESRPFLQTARILAPGLLVLSWNAYISLKVWVLTTLMLVLLTILLMIVRRWWKSRLFWRDMALLSVAGVILIVPIIAPYFQSGNLAGAIGQFTPEKGIDLFGVFISAPGYPPLMTPILAEQIGFPEARWGGGSSYLGLVSFALVIVGLVRYRRDNHHKWLWFGLAVAFWALSLGTLIRINGQTYENVWTPYRFLEGIPLFQAIRQPKRFALMFVLPWAVLVGYGAAWLREKVSVRRPVLASVLVGFLSVLLLYEINEVPLEHRAALSSPFYDFLLEEAPPGALINLPMGRQAAKTYMMEQTIHHRPLVEGAVARLPAGAYDYITANRLLDDWLNTRRPKCGEYDMAQAVAALQADGFIYIVLQSDNEKLVAYFEDTPATYEDDQMVAYSLEDFAANLPCP